jgi:hypothetical protein
MHCNGYARLSERVWVKMRRTRIEHMLSALPSLATFERTCRDVGLVPTTDSCTAADASLFDHLVGAGEQRMWHSEPERLGGLEIAAHNKPRRL